MRPQKVNDQELISGLMEVLRNKGYDGASLNELAAATGLKKASLYHRFPGGKKEITATVLSFVLSWINEHIYQELTRSDKTVEQRIDKVIQNLDQLYGCGEKTCLLRALSMDSGISLFGQQLEQSMQIWMDGFSLLGTELGWDEAKAKAQATETLVIIQGSLVVSKALNQTTPFQKALRQIRSAYVS